MGKCNIEGLPQNEILVMTSELYVAFCESGCRPTCHGCQRPIEPYNKFKLEPIMAIPPGYNKSITSIDAMLCEKCRAIDVSAREVNRAIARSRQQSTRQFYGQPIGKGYFRIK